MADPGASRLVLFRLGSQLWAAPASVVREVIASVPVTRIPGTAQAVAGLVNLRGTLLTVVDGRRALGVAEREGAAESILVLERGGRPYGVSIDEVLDLVEVRPAELKPGPPPAGIDPRLIRAHGRHAGRAFAVMDTEALLAPVLG